LNESVKRKPENLYVTITWRDDTEAADSRC